MKKIISLFFVFTLVVFLSSQSLVLATYTDVSVSEAKQMIDTNPGLVILDVRTQEEYNESHIQNAVLIPVNELESRLDELDKEKETLVYCKSGVRSATASQTLVDNGFLNVYNMLGGITAWKDEGYPVYVKYSSIQAAINNANEGDTLFVSSGTNYEHVTVNKSLNLQGENKETTIIDGSGIGSTVFVSANNVNITGFTIRNSGGAISGTIPDAGINIRHANNCNISGNHLTNNYVGVFVRPSTNSWFMENVMIDNHIGIDINNQSVLNIVSRNIMQENNVSIHVYYADFNFFFENKLTDNPVGVAVRYSSNNTFSQNEIRSGLNGIIFNSANFNTISKNMVSDLEYGIQLKVYADHNVISENSIENCSYAGIDLDDHSCDNSLSKNTIEKSEVGIDISNWSVNNTISRNHLNANLVGMHFWYANLNEIFENDITNNYGGAIILYSQSNRFYHNTLLNNTQQVKTSNNYTNWLDNGYPSGGNYWSDHNPPDFYSGPYQNETGSDRIGDIPYVINASNKDGYPLIYHYGYLPSPDVKDDGVVDIFDVVTVAKAFGCIPGDPDWNPMADINGSTIEDLDEIIDIFDIVTIAKDFGENV